MYALVPATKPFLPCITDDKTISYVGLILVIFILLFPSWHGFYASTKYVPLGSCKHSSITFITIIVITMLYRSDFPSFDA